MNEKEAWEWIRKANWKKDHDYERIQKFFEKHLTPNERKQLRNFYDKKMKELYQKHKTYWLKYIPISDDSWMDLRAEVIGRGKSFYNSITPTKLRQMALNDDYHENFGYSMQFDVIDDFWGVKK